METMKITRKSTLTGITHTRELPVTQEELDRHANGELAQMVWPHLDKYDREFLISGSTKEEWERAFGSSSPIIEPLRKNELYTIVREDGASIAVTDDVGQLANIISDEYGQAKVTIDRIDYNKSDCSYTVFATIFDDGEEEGNEYEFTLTSTVFYRKPKLVIDQLVMADIEWSSVPKEILEELSGQHIYKDSETGLEEHIYSIDMDIFTDISERVVQFINRIREEAPEAAFFRFINLKL